MALLWPGLRDAAAALVLASLLSFGLQPCPARAAEVFIPHYWEPSLRLDKPDVSSLRVIRFLTDDDYPPMNFRHKGTLHIIINADGPERIEQEWWLNEGEHRDYYYVEDEEGRRYWLFRLGHYDADKNYGWFLHGYFA